MTATPRRTASTRPCAMLQRLLIRLAPWLLAPCAALAAPVAAASHNDAPLSQACAPCTVEAPPMQLAGRYSRRSDVSAFFVSEKLDGVRAWWDGQRLVSRGGAVIAAPAWFVAGFPPQPLDGELWMGRGTFGELSGAVRRHTPDDAQWRRIRYMAFDLPASGAPFEIRLQQLQEIVQNANTPNLALVPQQRVADHSALMRMLDDITAQGGEGLMLHRADALHQPGRNAALLKLKKADDAEAVVIAHLPGKGKYSSQTGALLMQMPDGRRFRLGSGLSDELRRTPPPPGSIVTYQFNGLTASGLPRFPRFVRLRADADLSAAPQTASPAPLPATIAPQ